MFFGGFGIDPQWAPVPLIMKFICHLHVSKVLWGLALAAISDISMYNIVDKNSGNPVGQHPLVSMAT